jgi:hypothetical protein
MIYVSRNFPRWLLFYFRYFNFGHDNTDSSCEHEAIDFLVRNAPPANSHLRHLKSMGLLS